MRIRILVIEDHPLTREGTVSGLARDPAFEIVGVAEDGVQGITMARASRPDVAVVDLHMPQMGGMGVLEVLRTELPDTRVLVFTASEGAETLLDAVGAGAAGYLSKRAPLEEVRQAVITIYGGGSVISPTLAGHVLREYSSLANGGGLRPLLTARELEVLRLVAQGHTDREIGGLLYISPRTVQNHLTRIRERTGLRRRAELVRWASEHAAL